MARPSPTALLERTSLVPFDNVAAGHKGVLMDVSGDLVVKPCLQAEIDFYAATTSGHPQFADIIPTYMGTLTLDQSQQSLDVRHLSTEHERMLASAPIQPSPAEVGQTTAILASGKPLNTSTAVVLENIAAGFVHPNIVDLKLGRRLWADDFDAGKREKREKIAAETTSLELGFRVTGMKIWKPEGYVLYNRYYGRALTSANAHEALEELLCLDSDSQSVRDTIPGIIDAVEHIEHVIAGQESRIYASSLLLIYEGDQDARKRAIAAAYAKAERDSDPSADGTVDRGQADASTGADTEDGDDDDDDDEYTAKDKVFDVRIIDFGHATWTPGQGPDENMLWGVRSVLDIFRRIKEEARDREA